MVSNADINLDIDSYLDNFDRSSPASLRAPLFFCMFTVIFLLNHWRWAFIFSMLAASIEISNEQYVPTIVLVASGVTVMSLHVADKRSLQDVLKAAAMVSLPIILASTTLRPKVKAA